MPKKVDATSQAKAIPGSGKGRIDAALSSGLALHRQGRLAEAKTIYESVLADFPKHFDALNLLATIVLQSKNFIAALTLFEQAMSANPRVASTYSNRGIALHELKRFDEALASYDEALLLQPDYAEAYYNRGITLQELKHMEEALASYDKAVALKNDYSKAYYNRGVVLQALRRVDEALDSYDRALAHKSDFPEAYYNRGLLQQQLRRFHDALSSYDKALALKPDYAEAYINRGNTLKELKRLDEALASYDNALVLEPDYAEAYINRGNALKEFGRLEEALASYDRALAFKPDCEFLFANDLDTRMRLCEWGSFSENLSKYQADLATPERISPPFIALALTDSPELLKESSTAFAQALYPRRYKRDQFMARSPDGKIRVGYFSSDFYNHATAYLLAEVLEAHDSDRFEVYGFSLGVGRNDDMRKRVSSAFDGFIDVNNLSDKEVAKLSRELAIDIAVDLKGYTRDARTGIFAEGAAPIQVNYLGYPGTMGADYFDYIVADKTVIPENNQAHFVEKVVYLPYCYQANDSQRKIADRVFTKSELGLPESGFVFSCFNSNYKILPATFGMWMRILRASEGSVLWLLEDNPTAARNLRKEAENRGIDSTRLVFAKRMALDEHLARHRLADLFIDTLPCNAHTTASDALWAGLPVLTCTGNSFASRVAASLLNAVGLPELITRTEQDYEARAIELASNKQEMLAIKNNLDRNRMTSPLFNGKLFALHIEAAYEAMYYHHQRGLPNESIEIRP